MAIVWAAGETIFLGDRACRPRALLLCASGGHLHPRVILDPDIGAGGTRSLKKCALGRVWGIVRAGPEG